MPSIYKISPSYYPLPDDWQPPDWLPPPSVLSPVSPCATSQLAERKLFNPPDRITSLCEKIVKHILPFSLPLRAIKDEELQFLLLEARKNPYFRQIEKIISVNIPVSITFHNNDNWNAYARPKTVSRLRLKTTDNIVEKIEIIKQSLVKQEIFIHESLPLKTCFSLLIFEHINLFQNQRFHLLTAVASEGYLDKESFTLLTEYIENHSNKIAHQIFDYGVRHLNWHPDLDLWKTLKSNDFPSNWKEMHLMELGRTCHADLYRAQWEKHFATPFLQRQATR